MRHSQFTLTFTANLRIAPEMFSCFSLLKSFKTSDSLWECEADFAICKSRLKAYIPGNIYFSRNSEFAESGFKIFAICYYEGLAKVNDLT